MLKIWAQGGRLHKIIGSERNLLGWNEFPDPNYICLHVLHIDTLQWISELDISSISRWPTLRRPFWSTEL